MKRRFFLSTIAASMLATTGLFARGPQNKRKGQGNRGSGSGNDEITQNQQDKILYIYQEEKVARDVYTYFNGLYPNEYIFGMIARSEQRHMDAAEGLCNSYGIDTTGINEEAYGEFVIPELQEMYNTLIVKGEKSLLDALYVGEEIEIVDINDLEEALDEMPNLNNVQRVYSNLLRGSNNHLNSFQSAIRRVSL